MTNQKYKNLVSSILFSLSVLYFYNPLNDTISTWNRAICDAVLNGVDINKRIFNFYFLIVILFPAVFILFSFLFSKLYQSKEQGQQGLQERYFNQTKWLLPVVVVLYFIRFWSSIPNLYKFAAMSVVILCQIAILIAVKCRSSSLRISNTSQSIISHDTLSDVPLDAPDETPHRVISIASLQAMHHETNAIEAATDTWYNKYIVLFTAFWMSLLILYFICPVRLPSMEAFTSLREYLIVGVIKNKVFLIKAFLCFVGFIILWALITWSIYSINKNKNNKNNKKMLGIDKGIGGIFDLACLTIIPLLFAFVSTYASLPLSRVFEKFNRFVSPSDSCNPLVVLLSVFSVLLMAIAIVRQYIQKNKTLTARIVPQEHGREYVSYFFYYLVLTVGLNLILKNFFLSTIISSFIIAFVLILNDVCDGSRINDAVNFICRKCMLLTWSPFIFTICFEVRYILIGRGITIPDFDPILLMVVICTLLIFVASIRSFSISKHDEYGEQYNALGGQTECSNNLSKIKTMSMSWSYLGGIVSIITVSYLPIIFQHVLSFNDYSTVYEWGNRSVFWDTWVNGKIPFLDYFSAHALLDIGNRGIYAFLNNDYLGIYADPYVFILYALSAAFLFFILKEFIKTEYAAVTLAVFPIAYQGMRGFAFAWVAIVALIYIHRKPSLGRFFVFWLLLLLNAFWKYDDGFYIGIACIVVYILRLLVSKKKVLLGKFIASGACVGLCITLFSAIYLSVNDIAPLDRLREWISLTAGSNDFWAMANFGQYRSPSFTFAYIFVPISAVVVAILIAKDALYKHDLKLPDMIILSLALTLLLFIPRGIIYHNLAVCKGITGVLLNFWPWVIALHCAYQSQKLSRERNFVIALTICVLLSILLVTQAPLKSNAIAFVGATDNANSQDVDINGQTKNLSENKEKRIVLNEPTAQLYGSFQKLFDTLLSEDETFFDFANITSVYAFTNRIRPFYTSQSPSLLTDEFSQKLFLEEMQLYKTPLAITGNVDDPFLVTMTKINHNIRYYRIAEHFYQHYTPIATMGDFTVWAEKTQVSSYRTNLQQANVELGIADKMLTDGYDFDAIQGTHITHTYDVMELPWIWANLDQKKAVENPIIQHLQITERINTVDEDQCVFSFTFLGSQNIMKDDMNNENGYYLALRAINDKLTPVEGVLTLSASSDDRIYYSYAFNVHPGESQYLFRISQDYYWYAFNIDRIQIEPKINSISSAKDINHVDINNIHVSNVRILAGD